MEAGAAFYVFHAHAKSVEFIKALEQSDLACRQQLIWKKDVMVMGRQDYHWMHEPILYGWKPGAAHLWNNDRKQVTVWEFKRPKASREHPTMKPVKLLKYPIRNSSKVGQNVLDPFGGSGSTLLACELTKRNCFMMEIDPRYCDVIVKRWEDLTEDKAVAIKL